MMGLTENQPGLGSNLGASPQLVKTLFLSP